MCFCCFDPSLTKPINGLLLAFKEHCHAIIENQNQNCLRIKGSPKTMVWLCDCSGTIYGCLLLRFSGEDGKGLDLKILGNFFEVLKPSVFLQVAALMYGLFNITLPGSITCNWHLIC